MVSFLMVLCEGAAPDFIICKGLSIPRKRMTYKVNAILNKSSVNYIRFTQVILVHYNFQITWTDNVNNHKICYYYQMACNRVLEEALSLFS